ncbi:hypothetical protein IGI37_001122 [Enterococcus sp. AZ194]|uniref:MerR family transcriptional regulator n=1 Tax=Enterococcus sp. AZ194 TaxID=2774629 RepID=UPI003F1F9174
MLTIGEFSNICRVSTKTLRYYADIDLILPSVVNPDTGYRYYSIDQLETMLLIDRLKQYDFSLEEIKIVLKSENASEEILYSALLKKKDLMRKRTQEIEESIHQLDNDLLTLKQGKSIMSYLEKIDIKLVEMPTINILFIRKKVPKDDFEQEFIECFQQLTQRVADEGLTVVASPMVLYHESTFDESGLETEFAIPIKEAVKGTRDFLSGLCLKTVLKGAYSGLSSVYVKQREWAEKKNYVSTNALYEIYVVDPSDVSDESELVTEVYYPVRSGGK